uniref:Protein kinase domain-containing protein n=1 Tax=Leptobrachium leishanense TaxID=445787 RepID=A0A8C5P990_9ANUR
MNRNEFKCIQWDSLKEVEMVGSGSFGNIYKARHDQWEMLVAVKELKGDVSQELLSEAKKMHSASSGPNLITLFGIMKNTTKDTTEGRQGIVMEYMALGSLDSQLKHFPKDAWALKFRILHEVAVGMNWLHNLLPPLLHLDLKPKNILLDEDLHVKISDFGLSKFTQGSSNCGGELGGTLEYMPPEAFQQGYQAHQSFDVYSFGILSCVVLTGNEPYSGAIPHLIPLLIPRGDRPLIDTLEKEASVVKFIDQAVQFTKQCWHNEKQKRPSFKECCKAWEEYYSAHKIDIIKAVVSLQEKICKGAVPGSPSTLSIASSNMTDVLERFEMNLHITEEPSAKLYAAPVMGNSVNSQKTSYSPVSQNPQHQIPQQNRPQPAVLDTGYRTQTPWPGISTIHQQHYNPAVARYLQQVYPEPPPSNFSK